MITCDFSARGDAGLCEFLTQTIQRQIEDGTLKANEKLPGKRTLALHLGVSVITVQNAYNQLISTGYLYSLEKHGYFVTELPLTAFGGSGATVGGSGNCFAGGRGLDGTSHRNASLTEHSAAVSVSASANRTAPGSGTATPELLDLRSNATSYEKFPFSVWSRVTREVLRSPHESLLQSQPFAGTLVLRAAITHHLQSFRNMSVLPEQIVIAAGSETLYSFLVQFFAARADTGTAQHTDTDTATVGADTTHCTDTPAVRARTIYALENPGYVKTARILALNGAQVVPVPLDAEGFSLDTLTGTIPGTASLSDAPAAITSSAAPAATPHAPQEIIHVTANHHFPTGLVMSVRRRLELLAWARAQENRYILEDDYDSEFRFTGKPIPPLYTLGSESGGKNPVIYLNTFSKTLSPSFRMSYLVLPRELVEPFTSTFAAYSCTVSALDQHILARFIEEGAYQKHLLRMRNHYRNLRSELVRAIEKSPVREKLEIVEKEAGLHFLLVARGEKSGAELQEKLREKGVLMALLAEYYAPGTTPPPDAERTFLLNYTGLAPQKIPGLVSVLEAVLL